MAFTTDSYVVDPIFFPGGDIGHLAICGTINDLAMVGAKPLYISVGLIIEEGFFLEDLKTLLSSMQRTAEQAGVSIVTGDTKVVPRGKIDKIFINTSGIGVLDHGLEISGNNAKAGDKVLINGTLGDHGMAILCAREGLHLESDILSDCAPLHNLVSSLLDELGDRIHCLRDPTRGGLATSLKEIALQSQVEILLQESCLPENPLVSSACQILGFDPLYVANEGKVIAFVAAEAAEQALAVMQRHTEGSKASIIGEVKAQNPGKVRIQTSIGGVRSVEMLSGEQLPRIC
jgi:hydrogenase expression/formation protein HypE